MNSNLHFDPDWSSPPGHTIREILTDQNLSLTQFRQLMSLNTDKSKKLLSGTIPLSTEIAQKLELVLGGTKNFWINRESQYRNDLLRSKQKALEKKEWISKFPLKDMVNFGWLTSSRNIKTKENSLLDFFGARSIDHWYDLYHDLNLEVSFRTSSSFDSTPESVISWIRQGEIEGHALPCESWNSDNFRQTLEKIRPLTREKDPSVFLPLVQKKLSRCGVALIINPLPKRCYASGATYFLTPSKALMLLSFRYLSDDHFWFTFFHEAGHLLLHNKSKIFIETKNQNDLAEEREANLFSANILIPNEFRSELNSLNAKDWKKIIRFARKIDIAPGLVVGQLQHAHLIRYDQLNKLKIRFKWNH